MRNNTGVLYGLPINNIQVWKKIRKNGLDSHFPLDDPSILFQVRHSGDPILTALTITEKVGSLNFGMRSDRKYTIGILGILVSLSVLTCSICLFKSHAKEFNFLLEKSPEAIYKESLARQQRQQKYLEHIETREDSNEEEKFDNNMMVGRLDDQTSTSQTSSRSSKSLLRPTDPACMKRTHRHIDPV